MKQQILPQKMLHKLQKVDRSTSRSKEKKNQKPTPNPQARGT